MENVMIQIYNDEWKQLYEHIKYENKQDIYLLSLKK